MLRKGFEREEDVVRAALKEFAEKGYEKASINTIIKESGISKGTFYYHFLGKEELFLYLVQKAGDLKVEWLRNHIPKNSQEPMPLFDSLRVHMNMMVGFMKQYPEYVEFSFSTILNASPELMEKALRDIEPKLRDFFLPLIDQEYSQNRFAPCFDQGFAETMILYLFRNSWSMLKEYREQTIDVLMHRVDQLITFIERGLSR